MTGQSLDANEDVKHPLGPKKRLFNSQDILDRVRQFQQQPLVEYSYVEPKTQRRRDNLWNHWISFSKVLGAGPTKPWIDLCVGDPAALGIFQAFLEHYVVTAVSKRPCLGPEEYCEVSTVTSGVTVQDAWCFIVNEADCRIMKEKRLTNRKDAAYWSLKYSTKNTAQSCGPAYEIGKWIPKLCDKLGLTKKQTFKKKAMSSEDVILILQILWEDAVLLPCRPSARLAFHTAVVIGGLGGWRPGSFVEIRYRDVQISWMADKDDPKKTWPTVELRIHHVKQDGNRVAREQRDCVEVPLTQVPYLPLCLLTLFTIRAVADDAFEAGYRSVMDILDPPTLEPGSGSVPLAWKEDMLDKLIVPITYKQFNRLWTEVHWVAGSREKSRPYSLRVGAAGRLDGSLTRAMSNFILSQSTETFERSYQPVQVQAKLAEIAYGAKAKQNDELWSAITSAFRHRDPGAPVHLSKSELEEFYKRRDLTYHNERLKEAKTTFGAQSAEVKRITGRIQHIVNCLEKLKVEEKRREYFKEVDKLRSKGLSTAHLRGNGDVNPRRTLFRRSNQAAAALAPHFVADAAPPKQLPDQIVAYVTGVLHAKDEDEKDAMPEPRHSERPRCLFGCGSFATSGSLTKHVKLKHLDVFQRPFLCPECKLEVAASPAAWCSHIHRAHGALHVPHIAPSDTIAYCLLCAQGFTRKGFGFHFNTVHTDAKLESPFPCPECSATISGRTTWVVHLQTVHSGGEVWGAILRTPEVMAMRQPEQQTLSNKESFARRIKMGNKRTGFAKPPNAFIRQKRQRVTYEAAYDSGSDAAFDDTADEDYSDNPEVGYDDMNETPLKTNN